MNQETVLSSKERRIRKAFAKKSRNGENPKVEIKVYRTDAKNAVSIFELLPEDGALELNTVLDELNEFIQDEFDNYEKFVIKVKRDQKDSGEPIIVMGGKQRKGFARNNNKNSGGFNLGSNSGLGIVMQLMEKNNLSAANFQQFKTEMLVDKLKEKNKDDRKFFKKLLKKQKKKSKKNKKISVFEKVIGSPVIQELGKGLASKVLGDPLPANVIPLQRPIEHTRVAGPPSESTNRTAQGRPNEPRLHKEPNDTVETEEEVIEMSEDQLKALEGLQLLENYEIENAGDILFTACHYLVTNLGTPTGDFLMKAIEEHKQKASVDLYA